MPGKKKIRVSDRGVRSKGRELQGKKIALAVCGGVASVEVVKIIREVRRFGASVQVFVTPDVKRFITALPLEWASGRKVVEEASSEVEYLEEFEAVLVCPATLNTLSKAALGLCDNAVTLLIASQWKTSQLFFVPTMNLQMWGHPLFSDYHEQLLGFGAKFYPFESEEDRLKMPDAEKLVRWLIKELK